MKQITLTLHIAPAAAARACRSSCGDHQVVLTDYNLVGFTADQRDTLARHLDGERCEDNVIDWSAPLTDGAEPISEATSEVVASLLTTRRARIEKQRSELAEQAARDAVAASAARSSAIAYASTCPIKELDTDGRDATISKLHSATRDGAWPGMFKGMPMPGSCSAALLAGRCNELAAWREMQESAKAKVEAEKQEKAEQGRQSIRDWVLSHAGQLPPNLVRAAAEGLSVGRAVSDWVVMVTNATVKEMAERVGGSVISSTYGERSLSHVPSEHDYEVFDAVKAQAIVIEALTLGESKVESVKLVQVDVAKGVAHWVAAVCIELGSTIGLPPNTEYVLTDVLTAEEE